MIARFSDDSRRPYNSTRSTLVARSGIMLDEPGAMRPPASIVSSSTTAASPSTERAIPVPVPPPHGASWGGRNACSRVAGRLSLDARGTCVGSWSPRQSVHDSSPAVAKSGHSTGRLSGVLHRVCAMTSKSVATRFRTRGDGGQPKALPASKALSSGTSSQRCSPIRQIRGAAADRLPIESEHSACDGLSLALAIQNDCQFVNARSVHKFAQNWRTEFHRNVIRLAK